MRIGYVQFKPIFGEPSRNLASVLRLLKGVRADLIVLPELAFTGYYFAGRREARSLAEDPRRSSLVDALGEWCRARRMHLVTGFAERARDRVFNSSLLVGPRGLEGVYRKIQLFDEEKIWFDPGDAPPRVRRAGDLRVGMMICFDWIFPEIARSLALEGADVIAHPSNLVLSYCQSSMPTRCLENGLFAVTANRWGADLRPHGRLRFTGRSLIVGPRGDLLRQAPAKGDAVDVVDIDPGEARSKRFTRRNHLIRDRRPRCYAL